MARSTDPVDGSTPLPLKGISEALTAHLIRQEALHRAEHEVPHELKLEALMAAVSATVTQEAQRVKQQEAKAQEPQSPRKRRVTIEGPFGLPWF
jgi:hypothetical protein